MYVSFFISFLFYGFLSIIQAFYQKLKFGFLLMQKIPKDIPAVEGSMTSYDLVFETYTYAH